MIEDNGETYYGLRELVLWCALSAVAAVALVEAVRAARRRPLGPLRVALAATLAAVPLGVPSAAVMIAMGWRY